MVLCSKSSYNFTQICNRKGEKAREAEKTGVGRKAASNHKFKKTQGWKKRAA